MSGARPEQAGGGIPPTGISPEASLAAARKQAGMVIAIERVGGRLAPVASVVGVYCIAGFLRIPQNLPDWLHGVVEVSALGLTVWLGRRGLQGYAPASRADADRRIEQASNLRNRPLAALADQSAGIGSGMLWSAYQERLLASLGHLRAGWPRLSELRHSRVTLVMAAVLVGTAVWAGPHAPGRLVAAFVPGLDDPDVPFPHVEAWITPPSYAPSAPVFLADGTAHVAPVPQGSMLVSTVTGLRSAPHLNGGFTDETVQPLGEHSWRMQAVLNESGSFVVRSRGRTIAEWPLTVTPDGVPQVAWGKNPGGEKGGRRTRLPYEARHAYGIGALTVEMKLTHPGFLTKNRILRVPIPVAGHPVEAKGVASPDLSDDPWAGEEVSATLVATSVSKKEARSPVVTFHLGSRTFRSPVARAVLDLRKRLALGDENRDVAADDLAAIGETPGPIARNTGTFLNLTAIVALLNDHDVGDDDAREQAVGRLWDLALDIEDQLHGGRDAAQASIDVRAAQEAVSAQLKHMREDNAHGSEDQAELKRRMEALRQAIARKMQMLAEQAIREGSAIPNLPGLTKSGDRAFQKLMERLQSDAAEGHEEGAMDKLQQLEDSIEKMRNATPQDMAQLAQQMVAQQKLKEQAEGLGDLIKQQSTLLDRTQSRSDREKRRQGQAEENAAPPAGGEGDLSTMSTADLLRRLGLLPPQDTGSGQSAPPQGDNGSAEQQPPQATPGTQQQPTQSGDKAADSSGDADQQRADAAGQHALMRATEELGSEFKQLSGKDVPAFSKAAKDMKDARHALAEGNEGDAVKSETSALKDLQQGRNQMRQSLQGKGGGSGGTSFLPSFGGEGQGGEGQSGSGDEGGDNEDGQNGGEQNADHDPLGRALGEGPDNTPSTGDHLPDTVSRERAHAIEEELRRRDSDRTRPREELDYLDRLLKSF
ncbi:DUF4175 domain-containing protein [Acetobacter conturbans]|uniref:DUF4175 family protein n=1 Tax=Acetobacter conturbans TaxID=1737472 RepID=A0ABX0JVM2_9PROT|nr:DUF4175 family protein [Acetobacter conturbans]NHN87437.1 DUF4175 family protein [Acetobacter conturbans]